MRWRIITSYNWCVAYDGKHIGVLMQDKPKMTYEEIETVIRSEGGYVDKNGFIHKSEIVDKTIEVLV